MHSKDKIPTPNNFNVSFLHKFWYIKNDIIELFKKLHKIGLL